MQKDRVAADAAEGIENVPATEREAARLFYLEGFTVPEIAECTDAAQGTIKRRLYGARRHLRQAMGGKPTKKEEIDG
jgi:RNA polymerase sigma-70 factor (ECF subfamily)